LISLDLGLGTVVAALLILVLLLAIRYFGKTKQIVALEEALERKETTARQLGVNTTIGNYAQILGT
jgi:hypothetical protein